MCLPNAIIKLKSTRVGLKVIIKLFYTTTVEFRKFIYLPFMNFMKAFDSVSRFCLGRILVRRRMIPKMLNLKRAMYKE